MTKKFDNWNQANKNWLTDGVLKDVEQYLIEYNTFIKSILGS